MKTLLSALLIMLGSQPSVAYNHPSCRTRERNKARAWGIHTMIDLHECSYYTIRSTWEIEDFIKRICSFIGVTRVGSPHMIYHKSGYGFTSGFTIMQHANGHTDIVIRVDESNDNVYIDVFSCKEYDAHELVNRAHDFFGAYEATVDILYRR